MTGVASNHPQDPVLSIGNLSRYFGEAGAYFRRDERVVRAVDGVSLTIMPGETLALVGESGCGKSTLGRMAASVLRPTAGEVHVCGRKVDWTSAREIRKTRRELQMIFQDPFSSLNPRMTAFDIVAEPLRNFRVARGADLTAMVNGLLEKVGLTAMQGRRFPHEFSGGQRQRIGIARAIALRPRVVICDEAVSALDVSVQAQIINLLQDLQDDFGIAYLFISHDLGVVEYISHRVAVMYLGRIAEIAPTAELFRDPKHPYTKALLSSRPKLFPGDDQRIVLKGEIPSPANMPAGCRFHTRCPLAVERCMREQPELRFNGPDRLVACHLVQDT